MSRPLSTQLLAENCARDRALSPRRTCAPDLATILSSRSEDANETARTARGASVGHLNAVMNSPELREVYNANSAEDHAALHRACASTRGLFDKIQALRAAPEFAHL